MWSVRTCLFKLIFRGSPLSSLHSHTTRAFFGFPKWARFVLKGLHTRCSLAWLPLELSVIVSFCSSVSELKCHFFQKWLPWPIHLKKNSTLSLWPSFSTLQYVLFSLYDFIVWNDFIFFTSLESICLTIIYILWQQGPWSRFFGVGGSKGNGKNKTKKHVLLGNHSWSLWSQVFIYAIPLG